MKVPYKEGVATHFGPESWAVSRKVFGQALTGGVQAGLLSCETTILGGPTLSSHVEGNTQGIANARYVGPRRSPGTKACTQASRAEIGRACELTALLAGVAREENPKGVRL